MITKKMIVTNNKKAYEKYKGKAEVVYMPDWTPREIFTKVMQLLEDGARLSNPEINNALSYYRTVGVFYGDENAPIERNLQEVKNALQEVKDIKIKKPVFSEMCQIADVLRCGLSVQENGKEDYGRVLYDHNINENKKNNVVA